MAELRRVTSQAHIGEVAALAREIWEEHYPSIIGQAQVDYMVDKFQSAAAISAQLADGYEYYIATLDGNDVGYLAIVPGEGDDSLMISKIYVRKSERGRGFGREMLAYAEDVCRERGITKLWLSVNRDNVDSIAWYERMGFKHAGPWVQDIGGGFVMDDYRMEKEVGAAWSKD